jgi:hypothetical protein
MFSYSIPNPYLNALLPFLAKIQTKTFGDWNLRQLSHSRDRLEYNFLEQLAIKKVFFDESSAYPLNPGMLIRIGNNNN